MSFRVLVTRLNKINNVEDKNVVLNIFFAIVFVVKLLFSYYCPSSSAKAILCPAGTFSSLGCASMCSDCPVNTYSDEMAIECIHCATGYVCRGLLRACE